MYRLCNHVAAFFTGTADDAHEKEERDIDEGAGEGGHGKQALNTPNTPSLRKGQSSKQHIVYS